MTLDDELRRIEEKVDRTANALDFTTDALLTHISETDETLKTLGDSVQILVEDARADRQAMRRIEAKLEELNNDSA